MKRKRRNFAYKARQAIRNPKRLLMFLLRLNLFAIPLYAILISGVTFEPLMAATTHAAFSLLRLSGVDATLNGDIISVPVNDGSFGGYVSWDSAGWKSMLAFFALVFATDFGLRKKMLGLLLVPAIFLLNVLRVWFMFYIATINVAYFELAHITVWSWGLILAVLALWAVWMKKF